MATALLIIDVNKFFLNDAPEGFAEQVKTHIESSSYDTLAFTVFRNTPDSNFAKSLNWTKCTSKEEAALPQELKNFANNNVFERSTYSGFAGTKLQGYLAAKNIDELTLCGIDTDACVLATAFSAFDLGYKVNVNFDLTFSTNDLEKQARQIIKSSILPQDKQKQ
jgi:nicotinamidase-related amidase